MPPSSYIETVCYNFPLECSSQLGCVNHTCVCDSGFEHDRLMVLLDICTTPVYFFQAAMATVLAASASLCAFSCWRAFRARGVILHLLLSVSLGMVASSIACAVAIAQGHTTLVFWVFWGLRNWLSAYCDGKILLFFFDSTFTSLGAAMLLQHSHHRTHVLLYVFGSNLLQAFSQGIFIPAVQIAAVVDNTLGSDTINALVAYSLCAQTASCCIWAPFALHTASDLLHVVESTAKNTRDLQRGLTVAPDAGFDNVVRRMHVFRHLNIAVSTALTAVTSLGIGLVSDVDSTRLKKART